ncbi:MAG: NAD(P)/FAD-dependent oxidoreductase [Polyangiaceae bacterium]|nr:NAD(P)/FAD-dependent oxidoreductase [Polyangiaceae bacterium]
MASDPELPDEIQLDLGLDDEDDEAALRHRVSRALGCSVGAVGPLHVRKRSLDARRGRVRWRLVVGLGAPPTEVGGAAVREVRLPARVVIVGAGPAGLFCAYQLARAGVASAIVERGKPVQPRRRDLKGLTRHGVVDPDSNYCFGEGGAGTYSDGKLYTRAHKRGPVRDVLEILVAHGAPSTILTDARPHIGSNVLPAVVTALRATLEGVGVVFHFGARVTDLRTEAGAAGRRVAGVALAGGREVGAELVVLAAGHSARDTLELAARAGARLAAKPFALGVRAEHPQRLVDAAQYGRFASHPRLPSASYRLAADIEGRGVFSFCMCPGGFIVPASTREGELVVNGMSLRRRDSPFACAGVVAAIEPGDWIAAGLDPVTGGIALQEAIERAAWAAGGGALRAPAVRVADFLARRTSSTLPRTSYVPGVAPADLDVVLDAGGVRVGERLRGALAVFDRQLRGYASADAILVGVETRTSCPVRMLRDPASLEAVGLAGLLPVGEGAGHAGGIVSAALDGMRAATLIAARLGASGITPAPL